MIPWCIMQVHMALHHCLTMNVCLDRHITFFDDMNTIVGVLQSQLRSMSKHVESVLPSCNESTHHKGTCCDVIGCT